MTASRFFLVLSVVVNFALAVALTWHLSRDVPSTPAQVVVMSPAPMVLEPRFDVNRPPRISAGGFVSPLADSEPVRIDASESPPLLMTEKDGHPALTPTIQETRSKLKQALIQAEELRTGEFTKPNVMYQIPPRPDLKPGRSTSFSTPHWDQSPVLRHGER